MSKKKLIPELRFPEFGNERKKLLKMLPILKVQVWL